MPTLANSVPHFIEVVTVHANDDKDEKTGRNKGREKALALVNALKCRKREAQEQRERAARKGCICEQKYLFNAEIRIEGVRL
jgi:hypothetical protein